ncbi:diphthine-ammonia ligase [Alternaria panax]|uniref:Diphthine--ammonia ligase n=1 Tax=Alternaria panax TaxID=48097 RepID=A0AAD4NWK4_9PLEO|nr:diphthine-ammonia ligase [Alternaria panax]
MSASLNVIALISGGKDSLFSILHCQANGHTVVALANLHPAPSANDDEDINSYMYQTVGHSVIPLYEEALGIPLYRQEITGTAVDSSRDYATALQKQEQDETEDLVPLLRRVLEAHPEANAVSTGAILSTYQRTRVESVALRLGLTPLSYLWQYPLLPPYTQSSLLHDMTAVGQKAIIIKTASGGLDEDFLGLDVANYKTIARVAKAMGRYGDAGDGAILGEGGEFETLALDGPRSLWKKRIRIDSGLPEKMEGGQAVLKIKNSVLEEKSADEEEEVNGALRIPELWDEEFTRLLEASDASNESGQGMPTDKASVVQPSEAVSRLGVASVVDWLPRNTYSNTSTVFTYSNLTSDCPTAASPDIPSRQLSKIFLRLDHILKQCRIPKNSVNHCTLLLRDMADFTVLNPIYAQYFSEVNPPARATIAVGDTMPKGVHVMLSVVVDQDEKDQEGKSLRPVRRQGLHVQGRSYWAPANIGPYSQAISVRLPLSHDLGENESQDSREVVYVAGQIPLIPASMDVYMEKGFRGQAALSLQHLWRIGRTKGVKWWTAAVAFIPASSHPEDSVRVAQQAWRIIHTPPTHSDDDDDDDDKEEEDEDADMDPWDRLNQHHGASAFKDSTYRSPIPNRSAISTLHMHVQEQREDANTSRTPIPIPPCFVAQVASLPRGVDVEWSATGLTCPSIVYERDIEVPRFTTTTPRGTRSRFFTLEVRGQGDVELLGKQEWTSATLYVAREFQWFGKEGVGMRMGGVQWVPCQRVWGEDGREACAVFVGRVDG